MSRTLPGLGACLVTALALALMGPAHAAAKMKLVANVLPAAPDEVKVTARTSRTIRRVRFFVDGRRKDVRHSVNWRRGRTGLISLDGLNPGAHRLSAVAVDRRGRRSRGSRMIHLKRSSKGQETRIALKRAKEVGRPKPTSSEPPLPPGILFDGGFDNGFDSWHVQALDYRVGIFDVGAASGRAAHFEVQQGDVEPETGSERAEVSGPSFNEGQDLFVRDTIRVSSATNSSTDWQLVQQLRENDWGGSPGMAVFVEDDRELEIGAGDSSPMYWEGPELQPDRWYDLVYRVKLSQDPSAGFVEVWLDGVQQTMLNGQARIYGPTIQRPSNYIKAGIYRSASSTGATVIDHDNVLVGTSYSAVMAAG